MQPSFGHSRAIRRDIHDNLTQVAPARTCLHDRDAVDPPGGVETGLVQQAVGVAADDQVNCAMRKCPCQLDIPRARGPTADVLARLYPRWLSTISTSQSGRSAGNRLPLQPAGR